MMQQRRSCSARRCRAGVRRDDLLGGPVARGDASPVVVSGRIEVAVARAIARGVPESPNEVVAALRGRDDDVHCDGHRVETGDEVVGKVDVVVGAVECHTLRAEERR